MTDIDDTKPTAEPLPDDLAALMKALLAERYGWDLPVHDNFTMQSAEVKARTLREDLRLLGWRLTADPPKTVTFHLGADPAREGMAWTMKVVGDAITRPSEQILRDFASDGTPLPPINPTTKERIEADMRERVASIRRQTQEGPPVPGRIELAGAVEKLQAHVEYLMGEEAAHAEHLRDLDDDVAQRTQDTRAEFVEVAERLTKLEARPGSQEFALNLGQRVRDLEAQVRRQVDLLDTVQGRIQSLATDHPHAKPAIERVAALEKAQASFAESTRDWEKRWEENVIRLRDQVDVQSQAWARVTGQQARMDEFASKLEAHGVSIDNLTNLAYALRMARPGDVEAEVNSFKEWLVLHAGHQADIVLADTHEADGMVKIMCSCGQGWGWLRY
jgi:hypothetical protein